VACGRLKKIQAPRLLRKAVLDVMPPDEKKVFAAIWCPSKLYGNEDAKKEGPRKAAQLARGQRQAGAQRSGRNLRAGLADGQVRSDPAHKKCVGLAPPKRGKPKHVPDAVTTAVLDCCRMLTAYGIPVFKSMVLGTSGAWWTARP